MNLKRFLIILLVVVTCGSLYLFPQMLNQRSYEDYYIFEPVQSETLTSAPMILYLHGSGDRGVSPEVLGNEPPMEYARQQDSFPFYIVAPVCDKADSWHPMYLMRFLDTITTKYPIDTNRIYVTGLSMGGAGTWDLGMYAPERFAALAPVCARFNYPLDDLDKLSNTPVWAFHGKKDNRVPFEPVEAAINELKDRGGEARLTLFPDLGHVIWDESYDNPELYEWFLSHNR